ncbi:MAG: D-glycero-alpha-D-manno-heptose-1,7-bisphosphate 7-phosphatase [Chloroflexota bacterium]|jgi:D-glycero-D-manno-heptose 1,7-bisphosphate phosphatase
MRKAVFLDRDGTLIRNHHYGCDPNSIQLMDGVVEGLKALKEQNYLLVVVTNQSGVARGYFTEAQLEVFHRRLNDLLCQRGVEISAFYYCPHHPDGVIPQYSRECDCRKPRPGMVLKACFDLAIDPTQSWLIGDILDDVEAGKRAGCRAVLLDLGTEGKPERPEREPEYIAMGFLDAARFLLRQQAPTDEADHTAPPHPYFRTSGNNDSEGIDSRTSGNDRVTSGLPRTKNGVAEPQERCLAEGIGGKSTDG